MISSQLIIVRFRINQGLCNITQSRGNKLPLQFLLLLMIHHHVCGSHQHLCHKCGNLLREFGKNFMLQHGSSHQFMVRQILHTAGAHHGIIVINFRHIARRQFSLQNQNFRLDPVPVCVQMHIFGNPKLRACLFDNDAVSFFILHLKHIIQVPVSDFPAGHCRRIPVFLGNLYLGVLDGVRFFHKKISVKICHNNPS